MTNMIERLNHSCAIFGSSHSPNKNLQFLYSAIDQTISAGYNIFVTSAEASYEIDAARYIIKLKNTHPFLHLIIIHSCSTCDEIIKDADEVEVFSSSNAPHILKQKNDRIYNSCYRILCITNDENQKLKRLHRFTFSNKEYLHIFPTISSQTPILPSQHTQSRTKSNYPLNLLCDLLCCKESQLCFAPLSNNELEQLVKTFLSLSSLTERESQIIHLRYAEGKTLDTVSQSFGVTKERIRQIQSKSIRKLRHRAKVEFSRFYNQ